MKRRLLLFIGSLSAAGSAMASAGGATDDLEFMLVVVGIMLLVVALLEGTNYVKRNGKKMLYKARLMFHKSSITSEEAACDELMPGPA